MPGAKETSPENLNSDKTESSENIAENVRYIKKLTIQRSILKKLIAPDETLPETDPGNTPEK